MPSSTNSHSSGISRENHAGSAKASVSRASAQVVDLELLDRFERRQKGLPVAEKASIERKNVDNEEDDYESESETETKSEVSPIPVQQFTTASSLKLPKNEVPRVVSISEKLQTLPRTDNMSSSNFTLPNADSPEKIYKKRSSLGETSDAVTPSNQMGRKSSIISKRRVSNSFNIKEQSAAVESKIKVLTQSLKEKVLHPIFGTQVSFSTTEEIELAKLRLGQTHRYYERLIVDIESYTNALKAISKHELALSSLFAEWSNGDCIDEELQGSLYDFGQALATDTVMRQNYVESLDALKTRGRFFLDQVVSDVDKSLKKMEIARTEYDAADIRIVPDIHGMLGYLPSQLPLPLPLAGTRSTPQKIPVCLDTGETSSIASSSTSSSSSVSNSPSRSSFIKRDKGSLSEGTRSENQRDHQAQDGGSEDGAALSPGKKLAENRFIEVSRALVEKCAMMTRVSSSELVTNIWAARKAASTMHAKGVEAMLKARMGGGAGP